MNDLQIFKNDNLSIDLFEHFDSGCDLCSTVCFCSECSKKMKKLKK